MGEVVVLRAEAEPRPADRIVALASKRNGSDHYEAAFRWDWPDGQRSLSYFAWGDDLKWVLDVAQRVGHGSCIKMEERSLERVRGGISELACPLCDFEIPLAEGDREDEATDAMYEHIVRAHPDDTKSECWGPLKARLGL